MSSIVYDTMKTAVKDVIPLRSAIQKKHKKVTDAIAECEMAFGPDGKITALANEAELKLRAAASLAEAAADDLISVLHKLGGAVPRDGAQIKLFKLEEGGFRVVVENANPPADPNSESSTDPGGAFEKSESAKKREAALKNQLDIEDEANKATGDSLPDEPIAFDESVIMAANEIKPQLTAKQRGLIHRIGSHDHTSPDDLDRGEKASIRSLIGRKLVRLEEATNRYSLNEVGWRIVEMIDEDNLVTEKNGSDESIIEDD